MTITEVRVKRLSVDLPENYFAFRYAALGDRMVHPTDVHTGFEKQKSVIHCMPTRSDGRQTLCQGFVEILTSEGITGIYGPIGNEAVLHYVKNAYGPVVVGMDPMACEKIWDIMFRMFPRAYAGEQIFALSAIDNAIWDIRCKAMKVPLYKLLGGPMRDKIMAYANCCGYSYEIDEIRETVRYVRDCLNYRHRWRSRVPQALRFPGL